jgi:hypothetical protein
MGNIVSLLGFPAPIARVTAAAAGFVDAVRSGDVALMTAAYTELDAAVEEQWHAEERYAAAITAIAGVPALTVLRGGLGS